jgi:Tol biopolymer transport system component
MGATNGMRHIFLRDRQNGNTELISQSSSTGGAAGAQADDGSHVAVVSDDGRFVAFDSFASNLANGDSNQSRDVFLRDRQTGATVRISQTLQGTDGTCPNGQGEPCNSFDPSISADGNLIVFGTFATLVAGDLNTGLESADIYLFNRSANTLELVTRGVGGVAANGGSGSPHLSADGRFVVFSSKANNLVANDPDLTTLIDDVFAYNVASKQITKISVTPDPAVAADGASQNPTISGDGSRIAFSSHATNLGTGDSGIRDVFIVDWNGTSAPTNLRRIGGNADSDSPSLSRNGSFLALHSLATDPPLNGNGVQQIYAVVIGASVQPASINSAGQMGNGESRFPAISGDGRFIAYYSAASDLVTPDNNGNAFDAFVSQRP